MDDDPFRTPGSPHERDEPVAFAWVNADQEISWMGEEIPRDVLWIPEDIVAALRAHSPTLAGLNFCAQSRLSVAQAKVLSGQLATVPSAAADESLAAKYIRDLISRGPQPDEHELMIEGP